MTMHVPIAKVEDVRCLQKGAFNLRSALGEFSADLEFDDWKLVKVVVHPAPAGCSGPVEPGDKAIGPMKAWLSAPGLGDTTLTLSLFSSEGRAAARDLTLFAAWGGERRVPSAQLPFGLDLHVELPRDADVSVPTDGVVSDAVPAEGPEADAAWRRTDPLGPWTAPLGEGEGQGVDCIRLAIGGQGDELLLTLSPERDALLRQRLPLLGFAAQRSRSPPGGGERKIDVQVESMRSLPVALLTALLPALPAVHRLEESPEFAKMARDVLAVATHPELRLVTAATVDAFGHWMDAVREMEDKADVVAFFAGHGRRIVAAGIDTFEAVSGLVQEALVDLDNLLPDRELSMEALLFLADVFPDVGHVLAVDKWRASLRRSVADPRLAAEPKPAESVDRLVHLARRGGGAKRPKGPLTEAASAPASAQIAAVDRILAGVFSGADEDCAFLRMWHEQYAELTADAASSD